MTARRAAPLAEMVAALLAIFCPAGCASRPRTPAVARPGLPTVVVSVDVAAGGKATVTSVRPYMPAPAFLIATAMEDPLRPRKDPEEISIEVSRRGALSLCRIACPDGLPQLEARVVDLGTRVDFGAVDAFYVWPHDMAEFGDVLPVMAMLCRLGIEFGFGPTIISRGETLPETTGSVTSSLLAAARRIDARVAGAPTVLLSIRAASAVRYRTVHDLLCDACRAGVAWVTFTTVRSSGTVELGSLTPSAEAARKQGLLASLVVECDVDVIFKDEDGGAQDDMGTPDLELHPQRIPPIRER